MLLLVSLWRCNLIRGIAQKLFPIICELLQLAPAEVTKIKEKRASQQATQSYSFWKVFSPGGR